MRKQKSTVDETIIRELLDQSGIRENAAQMKPEIREWFKRLLVDQGIYARYVKEREKGKR